MDIKKRFEKMDMEKKVEKPFGFFQRLYFRRKLEFGNEAYEEMEKKKLEEDIKIKTEQVKERQKMAGKIKLQEAILERQRKEEEELDLKIESAKKKKYDAQNSLFFNAIVVLAVIFFFVFIHFRS